MATFTEAEIKQIHRLFSLEREELHPGSSLRTAISQTERDDVTYSTTFVEDVQVLLVEITALDTEITQQAADSNVREFREEGFYRVRYQDNGGLVGVSSAEKGSKMQEIKRLLKLDEYITTGSQQYARVIGIQSLNGSFS